MIHILKTIKKGIPSISLMPSSEPIPIFTDKEEYEKCSLLKARIRDIKRKLKEYEDDEI